MQNIQKKAISTTNEISQLTNTSFDANIDIFTKKQFSNAYEWNLENNLKHERLPKHSKHGNKLLSALKPYGNSHLEKTTLLDRKISKRAKSNLNRRILRNMGKTLMKIEPLRKNNDYKSSKYGYYESLDHQEARNKINFVTVVYAVEALDTQMVLQRAKELKDEIIDYVSKVSGASCIGTIELEIVAIKQMRRIRDFNNSKNQSENLTIDEDGVINFSDDEDLEKLKEARKLDCCEKLGRHLTEDQINGESGQFLIHFHGIVWVDQPEKLQQLADIFRTNPSWNKAPRQVQFKYLYKVFNDEPVSIEQSIRKISLYITKGGIPLQNGNGSLRYSAEFPTDLPMSFDEYLNYNDRDNDSKRQSLIEKGDLLDIPNLSHYEINSLVVAVNSMMDWNKSRTGYVVSVGL